ncbi:MAG TPA: CDP-alcohol phosphatidyltransferase family protein [Candidatus Cloacimonadota bacterium]|nr:CDP-alcohol phosphatidyltransferase family protein [Candidatus Cloacimonadota bacterium]
MEENQTEHPAERIIDTLTGPWEKKVLRKLALALPPKVVPDHLTILGLFSTLVIAAGYCLTWYSPYWLFLASFGFILNWYADSLDGTLARVRKIERERYGYFVDHICDAWSTVIMCLALGISPLMQMELGMLLAIGYLLLNIYAHIGAYTKAEFRISFLKFGPTEIRLVIIIFNTVICFWNPKIWLSAHNYLTFYDLGAIFFSVVFFIIFMWNSVKTAIVLDKLDRAQKREGQ